MVFSLNNFINMCRCSGVQSEEVQANLARLTGSSSEESSSEEYSLDLQEIRDQAFLFLQETYDNTSSKTFNRKEFIQAVEGSLPLLTGYNVSNNIKLKIVNKLVQDKFKMREKSTNITNREELKSLEEEQGAIRGHTNRKSHLWYANKILESMENHPIEISMLTQKSELSEQNLARLEILTNTLNEMEDTVFSEVLHQYVFRASSPEINQNEHSTELIILSYLSPEKREIFIQELLKRNDGLFQLSKILDCELDGGINIINRLEGDFSKNISMNHLQKFIDEYENFPLESRVSGKTSNTFTTRFNNKEKHLNIISMMTLTLMKRHFNRGDKGEAVIRQAFQEISKDKEVLGHFFNMLNDYDDIFEHEGVFAINEMEKSMLRRCYFESNPYLQLDSFSDIALYCRADPERIRNFTEVLYAKSKSKDAEIILDGMRDQALDLIEQMLIDDVAKCLKTNSDNIAENMRPIFYIFTHDTLSDDVKISCAYRLAYDKISSMQGEATDIPHFETKEELEEVKAQFGMGRSATFSRMWCAEKILESMHVGSHSLIETAQSTLVYPPVFFERLGDALNTLDENSFRNAIKQTFFNEVLTKNKRNVFTQLSEEKKGILFEELMKREDLCYQFIAILGKDIEELLSRQYLIEDHLSVDSFKKMAEEYKIKQKLEKQYKSNHSPAMRGIKEIPVVGFFIRDVEAQASFDLPDKSYRKVLVSIALMTINTALESENDPEGVAREVLGEIAKDPQIARDFFQALNRKGNVFNLNSEQREFINTMAIGGASSAGWPDSPKESQALLTFFLLLEDLNRLEQLDEQSLSTSGSQRRSIGIEDEVRWEIEALIQSATKKIRSLALQHDTATNEELQLAERVLGRLKIIKQGILAANLNKTQMEKWNKYFESAQKALDKAILPWMLPTQFDRLLDEIQTFAEKGEFSETTRKHFNETTLAQIKSAQNAWRPHRELSGLQRQKYEETIELLEDFKNFLEETGVEKKELSRWNSSIDKVITETQKMLR